MERNYKLRIDDILDCMDKIKKYIKNKTIDDFYEDQELQDAVIRRLEIIGEATKHIPSSIRKLNPDIPWRKMAGMRDVAIHDYSDLVVNTIWNTITNELSQSRIQLDKLKKQLLKEWGKVRK